MSCIKEEMIQKYIDKETTAIENSIIEKHHSNCETCLKKVESQRRLAFGLKKAIHLLEKDMFEIPIMIKPIPNLKRTVSLRKRIIYLSIASASILLMALFINQKENVTIPEYILITTSFSNEYDANKTLSQQPMILNIVDLEGNVTEIFLQ